MFFKCVLIFLACVVVSQQEPVKVTVYYESLCPASIRFITKQLYPTWRAFGDKAARYMTLDFVPYGKATQTRNESGWQFVCQHGEPECTANKLQVCGLHALQHSATELAAILSKLPPAEKKPASSEEVDDPLPSVSTTEAVQGTVDVRGVLPLNYNSTGEVTSSTTSVPDASPRSRRDADTTEVPSTTEAPTQNVQEMTPLQNSENTTVSVPNSGLMPSNETGVSVIIPEETVNNPPADVNVIKEAAPYVSDYQMGTLEHNADQVITFIFCIMSVAKPEDALEACATGSGLSADITSAIKTCYNTSQGDDILAAYGDKTHAAVPKISLVPFEGHVPQVTFNGVYNADDESEAFDQFKEVICKKQTSSYLRNKCKKPRFGLQRPGSGFLVPLLAAGAGALGGYALGSSRNKQHGYPGSYNPYGNPSQNQFYPGQSQSYNPYGSGGSQQHYQGQTYPGQSHPGQSYPGQSYPGQSYPGQSHQGQSYPGQSYPGQTHAGQTYNAQQFPPTQNQQYPGQTAPHNPAYGAGGVQQYPPTQNQQYPGQTAPHNPAYGAGGVQQFPPTQNQQYPGQTAPHNPAYGAGGVQQFPPTQNQQYPGQTAPYNPAYGAGGVQQYPPTQNQQYPGQTAPHNPAYGAGGVQQVPSAPKQPAYNPAYTSGGVQQSSPTDNQRLSYAAPPPAVAPSAPVKPPAPGWNAQSQPSAAKPQVGWVAPTQSSRVTNPSLSDKWVSASKQIVTKPPTRPPTRPTRPPTRPPATQPPRRTTGSKSKTPSRKRKH